MVEAAIHVSTGSIFPHPRNPAGVFPIEAARRNYGTILASGNRTLRNYLLFCYLPRLFLWFWQQSQTDFLKDGKVIPERVEGLNTEDARAIKAAVTIPVLCISRRDGLRHHLGRRRRLGIFADRQWRILHRPIDLAMGDTRANQPIMAMSVPKPVSVPKSV